MSATESISIRPATAADAAAIAGFNQAMALETEGKQLSPSAVQGGVLAVFADAARGFYLVAEQAGDVVGGLMVTFEWSDWRNADFWWIQSVYVVPQARRQGIFARLYGEIEVRARAAGACGLRLYVENENASAIATYHSLGMGDAQYRVMEQSFK